MLEYNSTLRFHNLPNKRNIRKRTIDLKNYFTIRKEKKKMSQFYMNIYVLFFFFQKFKYHCTVNDHCLKFINYWPLREFYHFDPSITSTHLFRVPLSSTHLINFMNTNIKTYKINPRNKIQEWTTFSNNKSNKIYYPYFRWNL